MINKEIQINWEKIMLCGNRSYKNMGDELILLWLIKVLQKQHKRIYVSCYDTQWMKEYLEKFVDTKKITFVTELPKGFRSFTRFFFSNRAKDLFEYFKVDTYIVGWWEILTEETPFCRFYWFVGIFPWLITFKKLYFMWWVQVPVLPRNKLIFYFFFLYAKHFYMRDEECVAALNKIKAEKASFFMDTSYFVNENRKIELENENIQKYIVVNLNSKWANYLNQLLLDVQNYLNKWYKILYVPISKWIWDPDIVYYNELKKHFDNVDNFEILDWEEDFNEFLHILKGSEIVISSRLHLFLISSFIGCKTKVYPYQKKILKMQKVLEKINEIEKD